MASDWIGGVPAVGSARQAVNQSVSQSVSQSLNVGVNQVRQKDSQTQSNQLGVELRPLTSTSDSKDNNSVVRMFVFCVLVFD